MDFYSAKQFVTQDKTLDITWRVLETIKMASWANQRDYASDAQGRPLKQVDIAKLAGIPRQRVSEAIPKLVVRGLVAIKDGIIYPVDDPSVLADSLPKPSDTSTPSKEDREALLDVLKSECPDLFSKLQQTQDAYRDAAKQRRTAFEEAQAFYRAWLQRQNATPPDETPQKQTEGENAPAPELSVLTLQNVPQNRADPSRETGQTAAISLYALEASKKLASCAHALEENTPDTDNTEQAMIESAVAASGVDDLDLKGDRSRAIENAAQKLADVDEEKRPAIVAAYTRNLRDAVQRKNNRPQWWGFVVTLFDDARRDEARQARRATALTTASAHSAISDQATTAAWIAKCEADLENPAVSDREKQLIRAAIGKPDTPATVN